MLVKLGGDVAVARTRCLSHYRTSLSRRPAPKLRLLATPESTDLNNNSERSTETQCSGMASSNSSRDNGLPDRTRQCENPFLKFKNTVDYHVGSVLQGIIGLPTILSPPPNTGNCRWPASKAHSEPPLVDLRRTSPHNSTCEHTTDDEVNIPVKKFHGQSPGENSEFGTSNHDNDDYDLFSAFHDSYIDRIERSTKGQPLARSSTWREPEVALRRIRWWCSKVYTTTILCQSYRYAN